MRVLVTGSLGYIGTVLVPMLQQKNHDVVGVDTDLYQTCTFAVQMPDMRTIRCDVRDLQPDDLMGTFCWLLSDDAAFVTGQTLVLDGGRLL